jgi:nondiscriminating aspartyl-tRNA synthetase
MLRTHTCGQLSGTNAGENVTLVGWINSVRISGKIGFIDLRDRWGKTQVFLNKELAQIATEYNKEDVLLIKGEVKNRPTAQIKEKGTGEIELSATEITILSKSETQLPIDVVEETTTKIDKRLDYRFLDVRREKVKSIFMVRSQVYASTVQFFINEGFVNIQSPKITASGVESGAEEFKIPYFGKQAALAQSPQIYKQMFVTSGLEKVFEIGTVFRAENSHTTRHLTEFTGVDFEMGFIESENDVMDVMEKYFTFLVTDIKQKCVTELALLNVELSNVKKIPRITMTQAKEMLKDKGKILSENDDLDSEAERILGEIYKKEHDSDFLFVTEFPWDIRPFYHMKPDGKPGLTKSFDLLFRGVEISTGAQREHRLEILEKQCKDKGIDLSKMGFYRDIFRFGVPPHGGAGMGLDRICSRLLNLENIREAILLPRDPERITP